MRLPLVTPRLELRRFQADDLEALFGVFGDPEVMRYVGTLRLPLSEAEVREALERAAKHWREHGFGPLAVVERATGAVVGDTGLQLLEGGPDVELTCTLARGVWGRGYATEAATAALDWGFGDPRPERIFAVADPENVASRRVLEKAGLRRVGTRRCYGADHDEFVADRPDPNADPRTATGLTAANGPATGLSATDEPAHGSDGAADEPAGER